MITNVEAQLENRGDSEWLIFFLVNTIKNLQSEGLTVEQLLLTEDTAVPRH